MGSKDNAQKQAQEETFEANFKNLEQLSSDLQENQVSIDDLVPRMQDALSAIKVCKNVLRETKSQLSEVTKEFEEIEAEEEIG